jgi:hypothetical protein
MIKPMSSPWPIKFGLLLAFIGLLFIRIPNVFIGRLWAEEGLIFLPQAIVLPWYEAIFAPYGGYLNIIANTAPLIGYYFLPLEYLPIATTGIGLIFQCVPALIVLFAQDRWLQNTYIRAAALLLIATPAMATEVWLQSLHSQFHLALAVALVLALEPPQSPLKWLYRLSLFLGPLCGPASIVLGPFFIIRAAFDRTRERYIQTSVLLFASILQFALFYSRQSGRSYDFDLVIACCFVFVKLIALPFSGEWAAQKAGAFYFDVIARHEFPILPVVATLALGLMFLIMVVRQKCGSGFWLAASASILTAAGIFGAFNTPAEMIKLSELRYSFLPQVLTGLAILALAAFSNGVVQRALFGLSSWIILVGTMYVFSVPLIKEHGADYIIQGPSWAAELELAQRDPDHSIRLWPGGWVVKLPVKKSPPHPIIGIWSDPIHADRYFVFEARKSNVLVAILDFRADGMPHYRVGLLKALANGDFVGNLVEPVGGQTLAGPYKRPQLSEPLDQIILRRTDSGELRLIAGDKKYDLSPHRDHAPPTNAPFVFSNKTGWWANAQEPGRSLFIEHQGANIRAVVLAYDHEGNTVWYEARGVMSEPEHVQTELFACRNDLNSCTDSAGAFSVSFKSDTKAEAQLPGEAVMAMERLAF